MKKQIDKQEQDIDFVIAWVDGNDPKWKAEKDKYNPQKNVDARVERFRYWDNLQYLFRGIEQFAPWVHKVYLMTWGHLPSWLNTEHEKLVVVRHDEFLPKDTLPVFNGSPIEINMHRIPGLSEHFVYFNDDMFLLRPTRKSDFFKNGKPCDSAALTVHCYSEQTWFHFAAFRHIGKINKYFEFRKTILNNSSLWFNPKYGLVKNLQTLILLGCPRFPGIWPNHLPQSFLKSTFEEVWEKENDDLTEVTYHRFRDKLDMHQWLFKDWQICSGNFYPRSIHREGRAFELRNGTEPSVQAANYIRKQKGLMICINDGRLSDDEFNISKKNILDAFEAILPVKSSFEK